MADTAVKLTIATDGAGVANGDPVASASNAVAAQHMYGFTRSRQLVYNPTTGVSGVPIHAICSGSETCAVRLYGKTDAGVYYPLTAAVTVAVAGSVPTVLGLIPEGCSTVYVRVTTQPATTDAVVSIF